MNYKFAQLIQNPGKKSKTITEVYIAQPDSHKENLAGKLFVLSEVHRNDSAGIKLVNYLTDTIVQNFYQNEKLLLRERMPSLKVEHIFEASLTKTNLQLSEFLKKENIKLKPGLLNISAGVVFKNELYIANNGKNKVSMVLPDTRIQENGQEEKYRLVPIVKEDDIDEQKNYRLFSDVLCGTIPPGLSVFISNEALPEYISQKQLLKILSSLPPMSAMEQIRNIINNINTYVSFAAIIIRNTTLDQKQAQVNSTQKLNTSRSIEALNKAEENAESFLTPKGIINFKKWFSLFSPEIFGKKDKPIKHNLALKDKIFVKKNSQIKKIKNISQKFLANLLQALLRIIKGFKLKSQTIDLSGAGSNSELKGKFLNAIPRVKTFSKNKKLIIGVAVLLISLFAYNLNSADKDKKIVEMNAEYENKLESIEKKQNQAEASLLYSNDEGAMKLFNEINQLLEELPQDTEERQQKYLDFKEKFEAQLEKARKITRTDNANMIVDLKDQNSRAEIANIKFVPELNKLYASDPTQNSFYIVDLFENTASTLTDFENSIDFLSTPLIAQNEARENLLYYFNNSNLITLNTDTEDISTTNIVLNSLQEQVPAGIYNSSIYVADRQSNQIYRHLPAGNSFSAGTPWLTQELDLSSAVDIAIDGHIYLLFENGLLTKLLRGEPTDFKLGITDPPLQNAERVKISEGLDYLYIMDRQKNRLLVFDKEGDFHMQYQGDNLQNLKDFEIDEAQKIIYFLTGTVVQKFNAVHFD